MHLAPRTRIFVDTKTSYGFLYALSSPTSAQTNKSNLKNRQKTRMTNEKKKSWRAESQGINHSQPQKRPKNVR